MIRTLIADDHAIVRLGTSLLLRDILNNDCNITEASNGEEVLQQLHARQFDVLVTDMNMPQPAGFSLLEKVLALQPAIRILVMTVNAENLFASKVFSAGAYGFVQKNAGSDEIRKALRAVLSGSQYFPQLFKNNPHVCEAGKDAGNNPFKQLSARELEVTLELLKGKGMLEVCNTLYIKPSTGSTFKGRIFRKLDIQSALELDYLARQYGVINNEAALFEK